MSAAADEPHAQSHQLASCVGANSQRDCSAAQLIATMHTLYENAGLLEGLGYCKGASTAPHKSAIHLCTSGDSCRMPL